MAPKTVTIFPMFTSLSTLKLAMPVNFLNMTIFLSKKYFTFICFLKKLLLRIKIESILPEKDINLLKYIT